MCIAKVSIVTVALLLLLSRTPATAQETAIVQLAASLRPGEWGELKSAGYDYPSLMRGDDILAYSGKAAWDSRSQQVLFIGQVHLKGPPVFIAYSAKQNAWRQMPTPDWAKPLKWFHAYENNAADSARGLFFHHSSDSRHFYQYDTAKDAWTTLADLDAPTGHGTAIEFFPEMKGLVRVYRGGVWFWSEEKQAWSELASDLEMGPYHNVASYSPKFQVVLLGGGNDSRRLHALHADGKLTPCEPAPVDLGIGRSLNVVDPVSGELVVLSKEPKLYAYHPGDNAWRTLSSEGLPFPKYTGHSASAAPVPEAGAILYFSSPSQGMKTYLYKHAARN